MIDQRVAVKRASATREELLARQEHISKQPAGKLTTPPQHQRQRKAVEDRPIGAASASQIKYRPLNREFVIPMSDGSELRVTERELSSMPQEYKNAAIPLNATPVPQAALPIPQSQPYTDDLPRPKSRFHWLFWIGIFFCVMLVGWILFTALSGWIQAKRDDLMYGNPRTFQTDANVGHYGRVSHFVSLNQGGYLEIFETQRGYPEAAKIYTPTALTINPADPVILSFQDVNGDGKPDMVITGPSFQEVMFNNGTGFQGQPPQPSK